METLHNKKSMIGLMEALEYDLQRQGLLIASFPITLPQPLHLNLFIRLPYNNLTVIILTIRWRET